ncbi:MAG: peptidylprolyl isomerase [Micromonosporaceae bacterium]
MTRKSPPPDASATGSGADCEYAAAGEASKPVSTPTYDPQVDGRAMTAEIATNRGTIVVALDGEKAPCTVASFRHLSQEGFYDDSDCHRLTTEGIWVLQCGDPTATGRGGPGYQFANENLPDAGPGNYRRGVLAMANAGPDTNGSQFFICYQDLQLDPNYTIFGTVTDGLSVVDQVAKAGVGAPASGGDGKPKLGITIESVTVRPA